MAPCFLSCFDYFLSFWQDAIHSFVIDIDHINHLILNAELDNERINFTVNRICRIGIAT